MLVIVIILRIILLSIFQPSQSCPRVTVYSQLVITSNIGRDEYHDVID